MDTLYFSETINIIIDRRVKHLTKFVNNFYHEFILVFGTAIV